MSFPRKRESRLFGSTLDGAEDWIPAFAGMTAWVAHRVALRFSPSPAETAPMRCPYCSHEETQVVETRESDEGDVIRRRRRCLHCDKRFTTYERSEIAMPSVVKKDGSRADFDRAKMRASMMLALRKRPVSVEQVDAALERIEDKLLATGAREVPSTRLGELVMRELKRIDKVAYVRFASVYRSFEDVDEFRQLIRDI
jgi:transcriptional repressor NrdR